MLRLLLIVCIVLIIICNPFPVRSQSICAPTATSTASPLTYRQKVQNTSASNLIAYYPLDETSGTTANDRSGNGRNGSYINGVSLAGTTFTTGESAAVFDGSNDYVNIFSSSLAGAFNQNVGTVMVWARVASSGTWTDGATRRMLNLEANSTNRVSLFKSPTTEQLALNRLPGSSISFGLFTTNWFQIVLKWSGSNQTGYLNGAYVDDLSISEWTGGSLTSARIGSNSPSGGNHWSGPIGHVAIWNTELTNSQISSLANVLSPVPTNTPTPSCFTPMTPNTPTSTSTATIVASLTPAFTPTSGTQTETPTHTLTPTLTLIPTETPTPTFTPTPTPTPTPVISVIWTLAPPAFGTPGQSVAFNYRLTAGGIVNAVLLFAIFTTLIVISVLIAARRSNVG